MGQLVEYEGFANRSTIGREKCVKIRALKIEISSQFRNKFNRKRVYSYRK